MIERRSISGYDVAFFALLFTLLGVGLLSIYSVTSASGRSPHYLRQIYWIGLGLIAFLVMAWIDYHQIVRLAYPAYFLTIVSLLLVLVMGRTSLGATRWLSFGPFSFQPSELAKISLLLVLAKHFSEHFPRKGLGMAELIFPGVIMVIPMALILKQPDLGTALAISSVFISMVFVLGFRSQFMIWSSLLSLISIPFMWQIFWNNLKGYQRNRLTIFMEPSTDPMGSGYHLLQSKIAIGSGKIFGKGLWGGTQSQLRFLPESHTDFIFSVFSEAWGFVGVFFLFVLFLLLVLWGIEVAYKAKDPLGALLAIGIVGLISSYFLVNVGMTLGLVPVVGIPLPLISYGGTSMVITLGLLGLLFNVKLRRFMLFY